MATTLLVAQPGGHLDQMVRLAPRLGIDGSIAWVTFESEQARELLRGERVAYARLTAPRDVANVMRNIPLARRLLREEGVERVVSTGAAIAASFILPARARRLEAHYIESAARAAGPSATGRLLARVPGVRLYSQYPAWAGGRWHYSGSVFDGFEPGPARDVRRPLRVTLTVGTMPFPFERFAARAVQALPEGAELVLAQLGPAARSNGVGGRDQVTPEELRGALRSADVVVCHSGVGSALAALQAGLCPVLVPRRRAHGEHVDDHQAEVAGELERRGLAIVRDASDLSTDDLLAGARRSVVPAAGSPPFALQT